jgi:sugar lactone lactonase YvrE
MDTMKQLQVMALNCLFAEEKLTTSPVKMEGAMFKSPRPVSRLFESFGMRVKQGRSAGNAVAIALLMLFVMAPSILLAQVQYVPAMTNVVGKAGTGGWTGDGAAATAAELNGVKDVTFDSNGNMYIVDQKNYVIRMVYAGGTAATRLLSVLGVACSSGCTYTGPVVGDIYTIAGTHGTTANGTDGVLATATTLYLPYGIVVDSNGNIYIADSSANRVRVVNASTGIISDFAGSAAGTAPATAADPALLGNGGAATSALLDYPVSLAVDRSNNVYIADSKDCQIRVVPTGTTAGYLTGLTAGYIYAYAGVNTGTSGVCSYTATPPVGTSTSVLATSAKISGSYGLAIDASGNIYIGDTSNYVIREVSATTGYMTTVAGNHTVGTIGATNGNGGPATSANLVYVWKIAIDRLGNLVIADTNAQQLRYVNLSTTNTVNGYMQPGYIYAIAGTGTAGDIPTYANATSAAISGELSNQGVDGIGTDSSNNIYVADCGNAVIRKISALPNEPFAATLVGATGISQSFYAEVTPTAGDTISTFLTASGFGDFTSGTESGCTLGSLSAQGTVCAEPVTFAPLGPGLRTAPLTLTDSSGNQYTLGLSGIGNAPQIAFTPGVVSSPAGTGTASYTGNGGLATSATLDEPASAVVDTAGNIYIADTANSVVRKISVSTGKISTLAGSGSQGYAGDSGVATNSILSGPTALALDAAGDLFIADTGNNRIREITAENGYIYTVAGNGTSGYAGDGSAATAAEIADPEGVAVDISGNIYVGDTGNNLVRVVSATTGVISTLAGNGTAGYSGDKAAANLAELSGPTNLALDFNGDIFIADTKNSVVRKVMLSTGIITTVAGSGSAGYSGDGFSATNAALSSPTGVAVDAAGNIYIADTGNSRIRQVLSASGDISTIAGTGTAAYLGDGGGALSAEFDKPESVALDPEGRLLIADTLNNRIRMVDTTTAALSFGTLSPGLTSSVLIATATNIGNQSVTIASMSIASNFVQQISGQTDCQANTPLSPGVSCEVALTFQPTSQRSYSGTISFTDNSLNHASTVQTVALSGVGAYTPTGLSITGLPTSVTAGAQQTISVTVMHNSTVVTTYTGTLQISSSDPNVVITPSTYTYTLANAGVATFTITFKTAGSQSLAFTDTVNSSLTGTAQTMVNAASAATINILSGNNQTVYLGTAFPVAMSVQVIDAYLNPVPGVSVVFTAPSSGASGTFKNGTATTTVATGTNGDAVATTFTSNSTSGSYSVTAAVSGVTPVTFSLINSGLVVPTVTLSSSPTVLTLTYGQGTTLTATLSPYQANGNTASGTVTFYDSSSAQGNLTLGTGSLSSGSASYSDVVPSVGTHSFTALYGGDSHFSSNATQNSIALTVSKASVTLAGPTQTVSISAGTTGSIPVTIVGLYSGTGISAPSGSINYQIGSGPTLTAAIAQGAATLTVPNTQASGSYTVTVTYPGDGNYQITSVIFQLTEVPQPQTITFPTVSTLTYGEGAVNLAATASSGLPATYKVDSGPASIVGTTLTILGAGTVVVEADQAGNTIYSVATPVSQTITVNKASTTTTFTTSATSGFLSTSFTLAATITPGFTGGTSPSGTVNFYSGGTTLVGKATLSLSGNAIIATLVTNLPGGVDAVTAVYIGDTNYNTSTSSSQIITITPPGFSLQLPAQAFSVISGQSVLTTLTVSSVAGYTGSVTFSCSNLPANTACTFQANPATVTTTTPATVSVVIMTNAASFQNSAGVRAPSILEGRGKSLQAASLLLLPVALLCVTVFARRRLLSANLGRLMSMFLLVVGLSIFSGCGGSKVGLDQSPASTPSGTTVFTVTGTDGTVTESTNYTLVVEPVISL